jgi:Tfp pilus assembly protein PilF
MQKCEVILRSHVTIDYSNTHACIHTYIHTHMQKAELLLRRGLTMEPNNSHLLHALALLEYKRSNYGEARHMFKMATEVRSCPDLCACPV